MPILSVQSEGNTSFLLSFISGFIDTQGFIGLAGLFTAHATGNLVLVGAAVLQQDNQGVVSKLIMIPVFMGAVAGATALAGYLTARRRSILGSFVVIEAVFLVLFLLMGVTHSLESNAFYDEATIMLIGIPAVIAMGVQNTLMRESDVKLLPTTVMTGNLAMFTVDVFKYARFALTRSQAAGSEQAAAVSLATIRRVTPVLVGFVLGCTAGAAGFGFFGFWCTLLPITLLCLLGAAHITLPAPRPDQKSV